MSITRPLAGGLLALSTGSCGPPPPEGLRVPAEDAAFVVHAFTSRDLATWTRAPEPVGWSFSSLGSVVVGDELLVAGLPDLGVPGWWEERFPRVFVYLLATRDLVRWEARRLPVASRTPSLIDPAFLETPEGLDLWYLEIPGRGDPAVGGRPVEVVRSRLEDGRFTDPEVWARGTGLVDVAPVLHDGRLRVFATRAHRDVVEVLPGEGGTVPVMPGATVPHARVVDGALWLLAQTVVDGRKVPVLQTALEDPASRRVLDVDPALGTCASPVLEHHRGTWILVCVEERQVAR